MLVGYDQITRAHDKLDERMQIEEAVDIFNDDHGMSKVRAQFEEYGVNLNDVMQVAEEYAQGFLAQTLPMIAVATRNDPVAAMASIIQSAYLQAFIVALATIHEQEKDA